MLRGDVILMHFSNNLTWISFLFLWFLLLLLIHNYPSSHMSSWLISKEKKLGVVAECPYDLMGMANLSSNSCLEK